MKERKSEFDGQLFDFQAKTDSNLHEPESD